MANPMDSCPICGGEKQARSKTCRNCWTGAGDTRHTKDACPLCGKPKLLASEVCAACRWGRDVRPKIGRTAVRAVSKEPNWQSLTDEFLLQFIGLFLGEGCVRLHKNKGGTVSVQMAIKLRSDDLPTLKEIHARLGGSVHVSKPSFRKQNPEATWSIHQQDDIETILRLIRPLITIPMRKVKEIDLAIEFVDWRKSQPFHNLDREKCDEFLRRIQELRKFVLPDL